MKQKLSRFYRNRENNWVAKLSCGHAQVIGSDIPLKYSPDALRSSGKQVEKDFNCIQCNKIGEAIVNKTLNAVKSMLIETYESAGISGLCNEGRWDIAIDSLNSIDVDSIVNEALLSLKKKKFSTSG